MTEQEMDEEAKVYGVAHTDTALVNFTVQSSVDLLLKNGFRLGDINALDPFTGDGVFIDSLLKHGVKKVSAYEIRGWQCQQTRERYGDKADIRCADAFKRKRCFGKKAAAVAEDSERFVGNRNPESRN